MNHDYAEEQARLKSDARHVAEARFNLLEFRSKWPIKPFDLVEYRGEEWEAISFPWPSGGGAGINIRRPGDPTTMFEVDAAEVSRPNPPCPCGCGGTFDCYRN
jgi:hypothetical protein